MGPTSNRDHAAARAGDFYEKGYCTEIVASPDDRPTEVALGATQPFDIRVLAERVERLCSR